MLLYTTPNRQLVDALLIAFVLRAVCVETEELTATLALKHPVL